MINFPVICYSIAQPKWHFLKLCRELICLSSIGFHMAESLAKKTTSTEDSKNSTENSDFIIKVEDVSYPVHQNILISSSEYFRGMLAHDTKERQDGFVEIKEIDSKTMKLCIDFMYDHDIEITMETAKTLLPASEFLQLTELSKRCVDVLKDNLYSGNCITVLKLARAYNCPELAETALKIFEEEFEMGSYEDFCKLDKESLKQHINDLDMEKAWDGIINWIKLDVEKHSSDIVELVKMLNWEKFPSSCFLYSVWSEPLFKSSEFCVNFLFKSLFLDNEVLEDEISTKNCLVIDKISEDFDFLSKDTKKIILSFMEINFVMICNEPGFKSLSSKTVLHLFPKAEVGLCNETARWKAAMDWMKYNSEQKHHFFDLLKSIRFNQLPEDFVKSKIKTEFSLLGKIPDLYQILFDCIGTQNDDKCYIAILYPDGKIFAWNISDKTWRQLPDCPSDVVGSNTEMFSFREKLCVLVDGKFYYLGKNETKWVTRATLKHRLDQFSTVVTSNDKIYVVGKERMSSYDPDTNTWDESLQGCGLGGKIFAGCNINFIVVCNTQMSTRYFMFEKSAWGDPTPSSLKTGNSSIASKHNRIYTVGVYTSNNVYKSTRCFKNELRSWSVFKETPVSINERSHLFFVDERLVLLVSGIFYSYDEICNSWMNLDILPSYSRGLGNVKCQEPVSVCSFHGNLKDIPPVDISK